MSEFHDRLIEGALGDFRSQEADCRPVPGAAAVRATVAHRRKVRVGAVSVVGALLVAAPVAAIAAGQRGSTPSPTPADSVTPTPVGSAAPPPSAVPSGSPTVSPADGRVTMAQLTSTPVDIPTFGTDACRTSRVRLASSDRGAPWAKQLVHTNLDGDPALETAALLYCRLGESPMSQVVAFERDPAGTIRTLGAVIGQRGDLGIVDIAARDGAGVTAEVVDSFPCCGLQEHDIHRQHRDYAWEGGRFQQIGGPTVWGDPGRVTDLQVIVADVTLGPVVDGRQAGTLTVTVRNNGPRPSGRFQVHFGNCDFSCGGDLPPAAWGTTGSFHAPMPAGQQVTATHQVSFAAGTAGTVTAFLTVAGMTDRRPITDLDPANNVLAFHIRPR